MHKLSIFNMSKKIEWPWSSYQRNIFDFIQHGVGNLVVESCAGSGKSTTMIKCLDFINSDKRILLSAFNRDIVSVLQEKIGNTPNINVSTIHSLGLLMLERNFKDKNISVDEFKYKSYITHNINGLSTLDISNLEKRIYYKYINNICKYVDYGRFYLCQTEKDLSFIEERYGIEDVKDEKRIAIHVINWGKDNIDTVDFTDMVFLPVVLYCKPIGLLYDWIFVDECQDLSKMQRELLLKCKKINTRMVSFGDPNQCIYTFAGSDADSFNELKHLPNTSFLPLSVSYRCADKIVDFAKNIVPTIEHNNDKRVGEISYRTNIDNIQDNDMILCRNNAPLIKLYGELIKKGRKCHILGKDIGVNMITTIKNTKKERLNLDMSEDGVFPRLYLDVIIERNNLMKKNNIDVNTAIESAYISSKLDTIHALEILSIGINSSEELITKINDIFSDETTDGIQLSTIHKAKGLESENVFIVCPSLMPSKSAKKDWEREQEKNLMYVAYTRAKNKLSFLNENGFETFTCNTQNVLNRLNIIEKQLRRIFGNIIKGDINDVDYAMEVINSAKPIKLPKSNTKTISIKDYKSSNTQSLKDILNKPNITRRKK